MQLQLQQTRRLIKTIDFLNPFLTGGDIYSLGIAIHLDGKEVWNLIRAKVLSVYGEFMSSRMKRYLFKNIRSIAQFHHDLPEIHIIICSSEVLRKRIMVDKHLMLHDKLRLLSIVNTSVNVLNKNKIDKRHDFSFLRYTIRTRYFTNRRMITVPKSCRSLIRHT